METIIESSNPDIIREAIVTNFVKLLGGNSSGGLGDSAKATNFLSCLSSSLTDSDVVAKVPTLEMPADGGKEAAAASGNKVASALPSLGQSSQKASAVPKMAASVLTTAAAGPGGVASQQQSQHQLQSSPAARQQKGKPNEPPKAELVASAKHMAKTTSWTRSTLIYAPPAMAKNISTAFSNLVQSRVKAWTLLLLRHSLQNGNGASRSSLLGMLSSAIEMKVVVTKFRTLPLPPTARGQAKEADVVLPLLFEVAMIVSVQGRDEKVMLRAPGTVAAHFAKTGSPGMKDAHVNIDTNALLDSMVEQARLLVFKAVARATGNATGEPEVKKETPDRNNPRRGMSGFSSALNLSADAVSASPRLQKARSSALRLNSILEGKSDTSTPTPGRLPTRNATMTTPLSKTRKTRSVQWAAPFEKPSRDVVTNFPDAKRQRSVQTSARLRSMKSFGRPHGGSSGGPNPNNATFNDFGGRSGVYWGRDGKLKNHPTPGGGGGGSSVFDDPSDLDEKRQNATFEFGPNGRSGAAGATKRATRLSPALSSSLNFQRRMPAGSRSSSSSSGTTNGGGVPRSLPRTATALESWLVNKSQGR